MSKKPFDVPAVVLEDTYDRLFISYRNTPKKEQKKWKHGLRQIDGSVVKAYYEGGLFKFHSKGLVYAVIGEESAQRMGLSIEHCGRDAFWDTVEQNATGNHTAKNHPIKVPTKPSEPVRG